MPFPAKAFLLASTLLGAGFLSGVGVESHRDTQESRVTPLDLAAPAFRQGVLTPQDIAAEVAALEALLEADAPLTAREVGRAQALAIAVADLGEQADAMALLALRARLVAVLEALEGDRADAALADALRANLERALRACDAHLVQLGVDLHALAHVEPLLMLVASVESRVREETGAPTLRSSRVQAEALLVLVGDLVATGAIDAGFGAKLKARLEAVLSLSLKLLEELEAETKAACDDACGAPPACEGGCVVEAVARSAAPCPDAPAAVVRLADGRGALA